MNMQNMIFNTDLFKTSIEELAELAAKHNVRIEIDICDNSCTVSVEPYDRSFGPRLIQPL